MADGGAGGKRKAEEEPAEDDTELPNDTLGPRTLQAILSRSDVGKGSFLQGYLSPEALLAAQTQLDREGYARFLESDDATRLRGPNAKSYFLACVQSGNVECVRKLLEAEPRLATVAFQALDGSTQVPLGLALNKLHEEMGKASNEDNITSRLVICELLLGAGASIGKLLVLGLMKRAIDNYPQFVTRVYSIYIGIMSYSVLSPSLLSDRPDSWLSLPPDLQADFIRRFQARTPLSSKKTLGQLISDSGLRLSLPGLRQLVTEPPFNVVNEEAISESLKRGAATLDQTLFLMRTSTGRAHITIAMAKFVRASENPIALFASILEYADIRAVLSEPGADSFICELVSYAVSKTRRNELLALFGPRKVNWKFTFNTKYYKSKSPWQQATPDWKIALCEQAHADPRGFAVAVQDICDWGKVCLVRDDRSGTEKTLLVQPCVAPLLDAVAEPEQQALAKLYTLQLLNTLPFNQVSDEDTGSDFNPFAACVVNSAQSILYSEVDAPGGLKIRKSSSHVEEAKRFLERAFAQLGPDEFARMLMRDPPQPFIPRWTLIEYTSGCNALLLINDPALQGNAAALEVAEKLVQLHPRPFPKLGLMSILSEHWKRKSHIWVAAPRIVHLVCEAGYDINVIDSLEIFLNKNKSHMSYKEYEEFEPILRAVISIGTEEDVENLLENFFKYVADDAQDAFIALIEEKEREQDADSGISDSLKAVVQHHRDEFERATRAVGREILAEERAAAAADIARQIAEAEARLAELRRREAEAKEQEDEELGGGARSRIPASVARKMLRKMESLELQYRLLK